MASEIVKATDLRARTGEELQAFVKEKQEELFKLRFQHFTGQLENVSRVQHVRREIARAKTILGEKNRSAQA